MHCFLYWEHLNHLNLLYTYWIYSLSILAALDLLFIFPGYSQAIAISPKCYSQLLPMFPTYGSIIWISLMFPFYCWNNLYVHSLPTVWISHISSTFHLISLLFPIYRLSLRNVPNQSFISLIYSGSMSWISRMLSIYRLNFLYNVYSQYFVPISDLSLISPSCSRAPTSEYYPSVRLGTARGELIPTDLSHLTTLRSKYYIGGQPPQYQT